MPFRRADRVALGVVFCAALLCAAVKILDPDCWWHLAEGRRVWSSGIARTNGFSWTFPDHAWENPAWLFDALLAAVERVAGLSGVEVWTMLLAAATFTLAAAAALRAAGGAAAGAAGPAVVLPLTLLALVASWVRLTPRPQTVTYLMLALLLFWRERGTRRPALLAAAGLVWANCHAGVVFGALLLGAGVAAALLEGRRGDARQEGGGAAAFLAGSLVNPLGPGIYTYALGHLDVSETLPLEEFHAASLAGAPAFFALGLLGLAAAAWALRRRRWFLPLAGAAFFAAAWLHLRLIPKFALVALPGTAAAGAALHGWLTARGAASRRAATGLALALAALVAGFAWREARWIFSFNEFGVGVNARLLPGIACDYVEGSGLRGNMYNDFGQGGYLIWRFGAARPVFQDGRVPAYPEAFLHEVFDSFSPDDPGPWGRLMDRWGVAWAIVDRFPGSGLDAGMPLEMLGWRMVHLSGAAAVFVRPGPLNRETIERDAFRLIDAHDPEEVLVARSRVLPGPMLAELRRIDPRGLILDEDRRRFAAAARAAGDAPLAASFE